MIVKERDDGNLEIQMVHNVVVSKLNALENFRQYCNQITKELEYELTRSFFPMRPPTQSHIIIPD